jgi:hypothetical protein
VTRIIRDSALVSHPSKQQNQNIKIDFNYEMNHHSSNEDSHEDDDEEEEDDDQEELQEEEEDEDEDEDQALGADEMMVYIYDVDTDYVEDGYYDHDIMSNSGVQGDSDLLNNRNHEDEEHDAHREQQQQQQSTLPLPREHSYLGGASHPLVVRVDEDYTTSTSGTNNRSTITSPPSSSAPMTELAILELDGVVLFPGSTIPVKLRDPSLIAYLGHQIEVCRTVPHRQPKVCLGIITFQHGGRRRRRPLEYASGNDEHPLVGRIGTIATIQYTQERTDSFPTSSSSSMRAASGVQPHVWGRYQELNELVFTAVGTGRFQVLGPAASSSGSVFRIRELDDEPLLPPPMGRLFTTTIPSSSSSSSSQPQDQQQSPNSHKTKLEKHDRLTWNLSLLTPIPYFVYQRNWPWRLKDELILLLQENQGRSNLPQLSSAPSTDTNSPSSPTTSVDQSFLSKSPTQFSYWLSSNMPFTQSERLDLLQMPSTVERLRILRQKVLSLIQQQMMCYVGCSRCQSPLAPVSEIFSFDGAEGATSNYGM